jgi:alanyl-tRNA synthetase
MTYSHDLRQKFLDFFAKNGHTVISSASLVPENDPTVLFTTAGMHPLVPYLLGEKHAGGKRVTSGQKCVRTDDVDEVGDKTHHTFFEMLGNWSFGDYFKHEAINWSYEFLVKELGLDPNRLAVSVFAGDDDAPFDEEAHDLWLGLGIPEERIARLPKKNNWWGPAGLVGPCGPDTEIFFWSGDEKNIPASFNDDNEQWVEIWNNVFMEYNKEVSGKYAPLQQKNVDTGMGLERMTAVMNGVDDNYQTDLFGNIIGKIEELSGKKYLSDDLITRAIRIIADHVRSAVFIMGDDKGVEPSNTDQGYVVRKLLRRAIRYGKMIGIKEEHFVWMVGEVVVNDYHKYYPELKRNETFIKDCIIKEEHKFVLTLSSGLKEFEKTAELEKNAFNLYQTYGFPLELIIEECQNRGIGVDVEVLKRNFADDFAKHQALSQTASAGKFKGGLADSGEESTKLHTTAHLLLESLRRVLGDHVYQKGSNITPERLRLDFSHSDKMTAEQIKTVEDMVNAQIQKKLPVVCEEMSLDDAKAQGAMGVFESKYGEKVKVYSIGEKENLFSREICGGPHVTNTGELGHFKIQKEESSSSGVRRIKAVLE